MKVAVGSRIVEGPWGGGNRFVISLVNALSEQGHEVVFNLSDNDIDIILLTDPRARIKNVSISAGSIIRYLIFKNPNAIVVHRVNECDERKKTKTMNMRLNFANYVADYTVFVGSWLKTIKVWRNKTNINSSIILNGADKTIFNSDNKSIWNGKEPLKLVTHHWAGNWRKGFDVYSELDNLLLDKEWSNKIDFTYIGNLPKGYKFKKTRYIESINGTKLADELKQHHIYITATINEPGSNHQNEGALCGLPLLYRNSGCLPEYCHGFGLMFDGLDQLLLKLNEMMTKYDYWQSRIREFNLTAERMSRDYINLFYALVANRDMIIQRRNLWRNIPVMLINQLPL